MFLVNQLVGFGQQAVRGGVIYTAPLSSNGTGFSNRLRRVHFKAAGIVNSSATGSRLKITLDHLTTGTNTVVNPMYVGRVGTAPSFHADGDQAQVLFSASGSVTLTSGAGPTESDFVTFNYPANTDLIVAFEVTSTGDWRYLPTTGASNIDDWSKNATGESGTTSVSGYTNTASQCSIVSKIEVFP